MSVELASRLRACAGQLAYDGSERERNASDLLKEAARLIEQPHLYDANLMTALHDILKSQAPATVDDKYRYFTRDRSMLDAGLIRLNDIYHVVSVDL